MHLLYFSTYLVPKLVLILGFDSAGFNSGEWLVFVRVTCCAGFGTLPIYNRQNRFAGISLLVKILIRNSRFDKASDAFNCISAHI